MRNTVIVNAPFNLGLKQFTLQKQPCVYRLPDWLKLHGFNELISPESVLDVPAPPYSTTMDPETGILYADAIAVYTKSLAKSIQFLISGNKFPIVIRGDCSILPGCMLGVRKLGKFGLFFIDGHTDYVTAEFSAAKAVAGMDLALLTGNGLSKLTNI